MWLGERSATVRAGPRHKLGLHKLGQHKLARPTSNRAGPGRCGVIALVTTCLIPALAPAETTSQPTTVGPARIICNATFCELVGGPPGRQRVRIIVAALPKSDTSRLRKCTGVAPPCIVTINGTTEDNASRILATDITWQD
jgi:hypothetical protein